MKSTLTRSKEYFESYSFSYLPGLPIVLRARCANIKKNFSKISQSDFSKKKIYLNFLSQVLIRTASELPSCLFGYCLGDVFYFVLRPSLFSEVEPWAENEIQKVVSLTSSILTEQFHFLPEEFTSFFPHYFEVISASFPSISEIVNLFVSEQNLLLKQKISQALQDHFQSSRNLSPRRAWQEVKNYSLSERLEILSSQNIILSENILEWHGFAAYKILSFFSANDETSPKKHWILNPSLPLFQEQKEFLTQILSKGHDIFRAEHHGTG